jgi:mevalonate kinase
MAQNGQICLAGIVLIGLISGIDNTVCTYGGLLRYNSKSSTTRLAAPSSLRILLINTKVPRKTKELVDRVKSKMAVNPTVTAAIIDAIEEISCKCASALGALRSAEEKEKDDSGGSGVESENSEDEESEDIGNFEKLEELIDANHRHLRDLGVSHVKLEQVVSVASEYGIHAKLTGAGGGGCAFGLLTPRHDEHVVKEVVERMEEDGFDCWEVAVGGSGVQYATTAWPPPAAKRRRL